MRGVRRPKKLSRVLAARVQDRRYNRFFAVLNLHDHCIYGTVARIQQYGVRVFWQSEKVRGDLGASARVMRYRILPSDRFEARELGETPILCMDEAVESFHDMLDEQIETCREKVEGCDDE